MLEKINIGIDIVDVSKFKTIPFSNNKSFYTNIFDDDEINYCLKFNDDYRHFAGKFAIKEATQKSINIKIPILNIITSHIENSPVVKLRNNNDYDFRVSLSHDQLFTIAVVISEKINKSIF